MSRRKGNKSRHHVILTEGYWESLTDLYKPQGLSPSAVIDKLVGFHLKRVDEKLNKLLVPPPAKADEVDIIDLATPPVKDIAND